MIYGPTCCSQGIRGYGNPEPKIVFLGIAPGYREMQTGRPFEGNSGKLLDSLLEPVSVYT